MSAYYLTKNLETDFDSAITRVTDELKKEGFGILSDIDVKTTLKNKLDVDFYQYRILGACNPPFANKALQNEDKIGVLLPCNVIVQEKNGHIEVSTVDPLVSMQAVENETLGEVANQIQQKLKNVLANL